MRVLLQQKLSNSVPPLFAHGGVLEPVVQLGDGVCGVANRALENRKPPLTGAGGFAEVLLRQLVDAARLREIEPHSG